MHLTMASGLFSRCSPILYMYALQLAETGWNTQETTDVILTSLSVCMDVTHPSRPVGSHRRQQQKERREICRLVGQPISYTHWDGGKPHNRKNGEECVSMNQHSNWFYDQCLKKQVIICETKRAQPCLTSQPSFANIKRVVMETFVRKSVKSL